MIIEHGRGRNVVVRGRDTSGKRYEKTISGHWPYCFVKTEDADYITDGVAIQPVSYTHLRAHET